MEACISVKNLTKRYDAIQAVDHISFEVKKNEIFAFLGPNGAGKSTTISILCTLLEFDEGSVTIEGYKRGQQDDHIRSLLGVVFQGSHLDATLSVEQNLLLRCGLYGMKHKEALRRVQDIIGMCSLQSILHQVVQQLSGGQRRRVDIARALIPSPKLLILDEPSTGLDPNARRELWKTILDLKQKNEMTIFMTTHYMEEAEIADHICVIKQGKIVLDGAKDQLLQQYQKDRLLLYSKAKQQVANILKQKRVAYEVKDAYVIVEIDNFFQMMALLRSVEMHVHHIEMQRGSIEDMYVALLQEEAL